MVNILLCATGSVATIKMIEMIDLLLSSDGNVNVRLAVTDRAKHFLPSAAELEQRFPTLSTYSDENEWDSWNSKGDPVLHIELRKWADMMVIAPLSANTLAKMAHGLCDNLVTCVVRAWDMDKPLIVAPAMNTMMFEHPFTAKHLKTLKEDLRAHIIDPVEKLLACGDVGVGAMEEPHNIVSQVLDIAREIERAKKHALTT